MADDAPIEESPSLLKQTLALGKILNGSSDDDPLGVPSDAAAAVFAEWLATAGPTSREPAYFADVAVNYVAAQNSNRDLWHIFHLLENYIEVDESEYDEEFDDAEASSPRHTFIRLPIAPDAPKSH